MTAYDYALDLLSARAYTTRNLRRKLVQKQFNADDVSIAIERLERAGLLDDERYAREYARQMLTTGDKSVRWVQQHLARRGVPANKVRAAIETVGEEETIDAARSIAVAARKKAASMGDLPRDVRRRRLFAFLARRGFEMRDIMRVIDEVLSQPEES
ncbi:MAG: regulatory protein RecX [Thermoanaerobaculia bacterium]